MEPLDRGSPGSRLDCRYPAVCPSWKGIRKGLWHYFGHDIATDLDAKPVALQQFSRVGRRGLEPRTYGLKAFPITLHITEYQAIATDSDAPRPSQNHPGPSRRGHRPEHERAM